VQCFKVIFVLLSISHSGIGQISIEGRVLDHEKKDPIPYANIGIAESNVGTISNPDGSFSIPIPASFASDSLIFSALGFEGKTISINSLRDKTNVITLKEKPIVLNSIVIRGKREPNKTFELGNPSARGGVIETDTTYAGRSIALLIENKGTQYQKDLQFPVYLEKASLRIFRNNLRSFKFRIRLQDVDSLTGKPANDLLGQSVVVESSMRNGWLDFELSYLNLQIQKSFFITFEQLLDRLDRTAIADGYRKFIHDHPEKLMIDTVEFEGRKVVRQYLKGGGIDLPGTFIGISSKSSDLYSCYVRETSMGEWKKVRGIVTATVLLSNQPK
jgi:hypothetical protein